MLKHWECYEIKLNVRVVSVPFSMAGFTVKRCGRGPKSLRGFCFLLFIVLWHQSVAFCGPVYSGTRQRPGFGHVPYRMLSPPGRGAGVAEVNQNAVSGWRRAWKATLCLLGGIVFWVGMYLLFFKATYYITELVEHSPDLEVVSFALLSCIPLILVSKGAVDVGVVNPLTTLASCMPTKGLKHIVESAIPGSKNLVVAVLIFFAVNLLASAAPEQAHVTLPKKFAALDPDGNGVLTGPEFEAMVRAFTVKVLSALFYFELGLFGMCALQKPNGYNPQNNDVIDTYWRQLDYRRPKAVALYLALNALILASTVGAALRAWGLSPKSILALGGVGGLAFGLASQNLVGNFMSGILLIVNRQFSVGDTIETSGVKGIVRRMGWTFIEIESGQDLVMLPNMMVVNAMVTQIDYYPTDSSKTSTDSANPADVWYHWTCLLCGPVSAWHWLMHSRLGTKKLRQWLGWTCSIES